MSQRLIISNCKVLVYSEFWSWENKITTRETHLKRRHAQNKETPSKLKHQVRQTLSVLACNDIV